MICHDSRKSSLKGKLIIFGHLGIFLISKITEMLPLLPTLSGAETCSRIPHLKKH
jgi:hypothetical protein